MILRGYLYLPKHLMPHTNLPLKSPYLLASRRRGISGTLHEMEGSGSKMSLSSLSLAVTKIVAYSTGEMSGKFCCSKQFCKSFKKTQKKIESLFVSLHNV